MHRLYGCLLALPALIHGQRSAPRGFNSWDSWAAEAAGGYGNLPETGPEGVYAAAAYMSAALLPYGYEYLVIDEGWSWVGSNVSVDAYGRPYPRIDQYPSAADGRGFRTIADYVHSLGLKLGVWTMRGIPQYAVNQRLPIWNSNYTADQAAGPANCGCEWDGAHMFGTNAPAPPALAYYASVAAWYAEQGIDYVKIDCMMRSQPSLPEHTAELVAYTNAFRAVGIEVSISPGAYVSVINGTFIADGALATVYRVTNDLWDLWADPNGPNSWPTGLRSKLDKAVEFATLFGANGTWPDLDMLPLGRINHFVSGGIAGPVSPSHFTPDEQQLLITLWCATGAPLMFGGRLPLQANESDTLALLTNSALLTLHGNGTGRAPFNTTSGGVAASQYAWRADVMEAVVVSLFNGADASASVSVSLADAGLSPSASYCATDLWTGAPQPQPVSASFAVQLNPHAAAAFAFVPATGSSCSGSRWHSA